MPYIAVHDAAGELISIASEGPGNVADEATLREQGLTAKRFTGGDAPPADKAWNPATLAFDLPAEVAASAPTVDEALASDTDYGAMSAAEKRIARVVARIAAKASAGQVRTS
jgi:hypothetical protein